MAPSSSRSTQSADGGRTSPPPKSPEAPRTEVPAPEVPKMIECAVLSTLGVATARRWRWPSGDGSVLDRLPPAGRRRSGVPTANAAGMSTRSPRNKELSSGACLSWRLCRLCGKLVLSRRLRPGRAEEAQVVSGRVPLHPATRCSLPTRATPAGCAANGRSEQPGGGDTRRSTRGVEVWTAGVGVLPDHWGEGAPSRGLRIISQTPRSAG